MGLTRRTFMALGAAGFGGLAGGIGRGSGLEGAAWAGAGAGAAVPLMYFRWTPLTPEPPGRIVTPGGTYSPVNALVGAGGNTMVVGEEDATLLVDTKNAPYGLVLNGDLPGVRGSMDRHISRLVINTHHHADHTGGNWAFRGRAPILTHAAASPRIRAQLQRYIDQAAAEVRTLKKSEAPLDATLALPLAEQYLERAGTLQAADFAPTRTVREESVFLKVGTIDVEVRHFGPGHTDNDLVVRLPRYNVVHAGDLLFHQRWPFIDLAGGADTAGWISALQQTIRLCDAKTAVVPGHGGITDVDGLRAQARFLEQLRDVVSGAIARGDDREAVTALRPPEFEGLDQERLRPMALGAVYDELTGAGGK